MYSQCVIFLLVLIYTVNEKLPPLSFAHAIAASKHHKVTKEVTTFSHWKT